MFIEKYYYIFKAIIKTPKRYPTLKKNQHLRGHRYIREYEGGSQHFRVIGTKVWKCIVEVQT